MQAMDIYYLGHSSLKIRGKNAVIVTDPFDETMVGMKFPKHTTCDIVTVSHSHDDHNCIKVIEGAPYVIQGPGEYEVKGAAVTGIATYHDNQKGAQRGKNTMYRIEIDGVTILHAGDLGHPLADDDLEHIGNIDIFFVPVGGVYTIDAKQAAAMVHEVDPAIVIPIHYGRPELNQKTFGKLLGIDVFLKEMGKQEMLAQSKLSITKDKLPEEMHVVVLES